MWCGPSSGFATSWREPLRPLRAAQPRLHPWERVVQRRIAGLGHVPSRAATDHKSEKTRSETLAGRGGEEYRRGARPHAYVANNARDSVAVINTSSNTVVATVPIGFGGFGVAITPF